MSVPFLNRQLFSDHWLRERLPQREDYALTPLGLAKLALWLRGLPARCRGADGWSADETQQRIVAPCLALLASRSERAATVALIAHLLYRLYGVQPVEIAIIEGREAKRNATERREGSGAHAGESEQAAHALADGVSYGRQRKRRRVAGADEPSPHRKRRV